MIDEWLGKKVQIMDTWIQVTCPKCTGEGTCPEDRWFEHPEAFRQVHCTLCRGHGFLLAKPVEEVKPVSEFRVVCEHGSWVFATFEMAEPWANRHANESPHSQRPAVRIYKDSGLVKTIEDVFGSPKR